MGSLQEPETATDFESKMNTKVSDSLVILCLAVGSKVGIVDKMMKNTEPKTSAEIAKDVGLKERYVREWLCTMTTGGIVDLIPGDSENRFVIPTHRHQTLSDEGKGIATYSRMLPLMAQVHGDLEQCFQLSGPEGIPYERYLGFHEWLNQCRKTTLTESFMMRLVHDVPGLIDNLKAGITMCEMGCGLGVMSIKFAQSFPNSQVHGVDIAQDIIEIANRSAEERAVSNCHFQVTDICNMPADWTEKWDFVFMYNVLHDLPKLSKGLKELHRSLKSGAYISIVDVNLHCDLRANMGNVYAPGFYGSSLFLCVPTSLSVDGGEGLGAGWGWETALERIREAGFVEVQIANHLDEDVHIIAKKK